MNEYCLKEISKNKTIKSSMKPLFRIYETAIELALRLKMLIGEGIFLCKKTICLYIVIFVF